MELPAFVLVMPLMWVHFAWAAPGDGQDALAAIASATGGKMKASQGRAFDRDCGQEVEYEAQAIDLNGDGQLEVLTHESGGCFGRAGVQMNLYIRARNGQWQPQFGFPGMATVLKTRRNGYPDIQIGGPGTCFPVWRFDGQRYQLARRCP